MDRLKLVLDLFYRLSEKYKLRINDRFANIVSEVGKHSTDLCLKISRYIGDDPIKRELGYSLATLFILLNSILDNSGDNIDVALRISEKKMKTILDEIFSDIKTLGKKALLI